MSTHPHLSVAPVAETHPPLPLTEAQATPNTTITPNMTWIVRDTGGGGPHQIDYIPAQRISNVEPSQASKATPIQNPNTDHLSEPAEAVLERNEG